MSQVRRFLKAAAAWLLATSAFAAEPADSRESKSGKVSASTALPSLFDDTVLRANSSYYAQQLWEPVRAAAINRQLQLNDLMAWQFGGNSYYAGGSYSATLAGGSTMSFFPGSRNVYSYYYTPFEPNPPWFSSIVGYPFNQRVVQSSGYSITPHGGNPANGYVYEPVYGLPNGNVQPASTRVPVVVPPARRASRLLASPAPAAVAPSNLESALAAFDEGDYQRVAALLAQNQANSDNSGAIELLKAQALLALADYRQASRALHRALIRMPEQKWLESARQLVRRYHEAGEFNRQLQTLQQRDGARPGDPDLQFLLGFYSAVSGDLSDAIEHLEQAIKFGSTYRGSDAVSPADAGSDPVAERLLNFLHARAQVRPQPHGTPETGPRAF